MTEININFNDIPEDDNGPEAPNSSNEGIDFTNVDPLPPPSLPENMERGLSLIDSTIADLLRNQVESTDSTDVDPPLPPADNPAADASEETPLPPENQGQGLNLTDSTISDLLRNQIEAIVDPVDQQGNPVDLTKLSVDELQDILDELTSIFGKLSDAIDIPEPGDEGGFGPEVIPPIDMWDAGSVDAGGGGAGGGGAGGGGGGGDDPGFAPGGDPGDGAGEAIDTIGDGAQSMLDSLHGIPIPYVTAALTLTAKIAGLIGAARFIAKTVTAVLTAPINLAKDVALTGIDAVLDPTNTGPAQALTKAANFGSRIADADPLGLAIGLHVMDAAFQAVAQTVQALDDGFKALTEDLRQVSPSLAVSGVEVELLHLGGRLRQDAEIGGDLAEVEIQRAHFEEDVREIKTEFIKHLIPLIRGLLSIAQDILTLMGPLITLISTGFKVAHNEWDRQTGMYRRGWDNLMGLIRSLKPKDEDELDLDAELKIFFSKSDEMKEFEESAKIR